MAKGKKGQSAAEESKADKWMRLANARAEKAINAIRAIGPLGNKSQYDFTAEDEGKLYEAVRLAFEESWRVFNNNGKSTNVRKLF